MLMSTLGLKITPSFPQSLSRWCIYFFFDIVPLFCNLCFKRVVPDVVFLPFFVDVVIVSPESMFSKIVGLKISENFDHIAPVSPIL